ncbi:hypothetical protein SAMN05428951_11123 [Pseudomonas sp. OV546]|nr:hypothetical protein SAMN05428951_11123 [Pseudomonas sp. OV546]
MGSALTAGHFWKRAPKVTKKALAPTLGTSLTLGVPVIRQVFGGPPPRAIHGAGRLNRHPCRFTPQIPVEFRPACLTGRLRSKARSRSGSRSGSGSGSGSGSRAARFASWLAWAACGYLGLSPASRRLQVFCRISLTVQPRVRRSRRAPCAIRWCVCWLLPARAGARCPGGRS